MLPADVQATFCSTLVDQWVRDGVEHAVVAPGSRSTPMALALASRREVRVHVVLDERSAAFTALGIGWATGVPAVVLCTSGTAATHFLGAVAEASLSHVPMLVLTANRPPELVDVGAPQAIDQTKLFGGAVRWFHDPGVPAEAAAGTWRSLARQAFAAATGARPGPVHLDLPFREPLIGTADELPGASLGPVGPRGAAVPALRLGTLAMELERERGVIIAGHGVDDPQAVQRLADATQWPIIADPRSGCRGLPSAVNAFDAILRHEDLADAHRPEVVLHLGEPPASKVLGQWSAAAGGVQVRVLPVPYVSDPWHAITHQVTSRVGELCDRLAKELRGATGSDWGDRWQRFESAAQRVLGDELAVDDPGRALTEPLVARIASETDGLLVVASSMPIRDVEWYGAPAGRATVVSNRGANGIDGTIGTAVGVALGAGRPVTVLLGDLALLHDATSLTGLAGRGVDLRIVVNDNDGGAIFSFLPQATALDADRFEQLFGTPQGTDLVALAGAHGLRACTVTTVGELRDALATPGPSLIRVPGDRAANVVEHRRLNDAVVAALR